MRTWCLLMLCVVAAAGCAYEKLESTSQPGPPDWVMMTPADTADSKVFVGIGLAENILDARTGRNRAMEDVELQIARSLKTSVVKDAIDIVKKKGAEHTGDDVADASYYSQVQTAVKQALSGVRPEAYYWGKFKVKEGFFSASFTRYQYYVKASVPRADYERLQRILTDAIAAGLSK